MRRLLLVIIGLIGIGGTGMPLAGLAGSVADVNGTPITDQALNRSVDAFFRGQRMDAGGVFNPRFYNQIKHRVLNTLISQELLYQKARSLEIAVPEELVEQSIAGDVARQVSHDAFISELQVNGFTLASYTEETRKRLMVERYVREHLARQVSVEQEEIEARYRAAGDSLRLPERAQMSQILLRVTPADDEKQVEAVRSQLETLRQQVLDGADFAQLARAHSQGPNAERGGDMGLHPVHKLVGPFADFARKLAPGELSGVFRTQHGWHLLRMEERAGSGIPGLDEIRDSLAAEIWNEKLTRLIEQRVSELREQGNVQVYLE